MRSLPGPVTPPAPGCRPQPLVHCTLPAPMGSDRDTFFPTLPMGKSEAQRGAQGPRVLWQQSGAPPEVLPRASGGHVTSHTTPGRSRSACLVSQHPSRSPGHPTAPHDSSRNNDQNRLAQAGAGLKADTPCVSGWDRERQLLFLLSVSIPHHVLSPVQRPPFLLEAFDPSFLFSATASAQGSGFHYSTFSTSFGLPARARAILLL